MNKGNKSKYLILLILLFSFNYIFSFKATGLDENNVSVGVFFYVWYGYNQTSHTWTGGDGTSHWNDGGAGIVLDYPIFGYYNSYNNDTLKEQIGLMKSSGIDFIVISWWGVSHYTDNASKNVFKFLLGNGIDFKACFIVEPYEGINYTQVYNYIYSNYVQPYNIWYMKFEGKPLIFFFNPIYEGFYKDERFNVFVVGNPPNDVDVIFWKGMDCLDAYGGFTHIEYYSGKPVINYEGIVSIVPRYDDKALYDAGSRSTFMQFDRLLTKNLYGKEWNFVIQNKDSIKMVLIYSWNEYHERTAIEPLYDYTTGKSQYYLLNLTKYYVKQFREYVTPQYMLNFGLRESIILVGISIIVAIASIIKKIL